MTKEGNVEIGENAVAKRSRGHNQTDIWKSTEHGRIRG